MVKSVTERRVTYYDYDSVYNRRKVASRIVTLYYLPLMPNVIYFGSDDKKLYAIGAGK